MHKLVCDVTGRHYNARNSDVSLPRPPRGKGQNRMKFRLAFRMISVYLAKAINADRYIYRKKLEHILLENLIRLNE